jgi:hypothetical protein
VLGDAVTLRDEFRPSMPPTDTIFRRQGAKDGLPSVAMSSPQDPRARRRERVRRARKNSRWEEKRAVENQQAAEPKAAAKKAT